MIRKLERKDKENWIKLYCGYAKFYEVAMNQEILDTLLCGEFSNGYSIVFSSDLKSLIYLLTCSGPIISNSYLICG